MTKKFLFAFLFVIWCGATMTICAQEDEAIETDTPAVEQTADSTD